MYCKHCIQSVRYFSSGNYSHESGSSRICIIVLILDQNTSLIRMLIQPLFKWEISSTNFRINRASCKVGSPVHAFCAVLLYISSTFCSLSCFGSDRIQIKRVSLILELNHIWKFSPDWAPIRITLSIDKPYTSTLFGNEFKSCTSIYVLYNVCTCWPLACHLCLKVGNDQLAGSSVQNFFCTFALQT